MKTDRSIRTFLAANSANGFVSFFDEIRDFENTYIIKGGPGTGKSSLMKKAASAAQSQDMAVEYVFCSSDPNSLDAVCIKDIPIAIADGTSPHTMEPKYPGAMGGITDVGRFWDEEKIVSFKEDVIELSQNVSSEFSGAYRWLKAAGAIYEDIEKTAEKAFNNVKASSFTDGLIKKTVVKNGGQCGKIKKRFISGITPLGIVTFYDTIYNLCEKVMTVKDKYLLSDRIISRFALAAKDAGYTVYAFYNPLMPDRMMHAAVPELGFAIASDTFMARFEPKNAKSVSMERFIGDIDKKRLTADYKALNACIKEAVFRIEKAKAYHDDLEDIYISAMNFSLLELETKAFIQKHIIKKDT